MSAWSQAMLDSVRDRNPRTFSLGMVGGTALTMSCSDFLEVHENERPIMEHLLQSLPDDLAVLDLGCGVGRFLEYIRAIRPNARLFGTESDPELLALCRAKWGTGIVQRRFELPTNQTYDLVLLMGNGLGILGAEGQVRNELGQVKRLLNPDGLLLGESNPLNGPAYTAPFLFITYGGLADPEFVWGFCGFTWCEETLIRAGFQHVRRHNSQHAAAFVVSARNGDVARNAEQVGGVAHDSWADHYDCAYKLTYGEAYETFSHHSLEVISEFVSPPARIIDFGAGTGRLAIPLAKRGYQVTAVEASAEMCRVLKAKAQAGVERAVIAPCERCQERTDPNTQHGEVTLTMFNQSICELLPVDRFDFGLSPSTMC